MKFRFILNPISGNCGRNERLRALLRDFVAAGGLDADVAVTSGPGHARALAREALASGCTRIVAVGGDGTVNEVAQALMHAPAELAVVPTGSGNGLARHLGLPASGRRSLELAVSSEARTALIDTGTANGIPFFNVMGSGLDADVSRRFNRVKRRGLVAYAWAAISAFAARRPERCTLVNGTRRDSADVILVAVANSDQYGNGAQIAPGARVDDGLLDLVALPAAGPAACAVFAARLFLGSLHRSPAVRRMLGAHFIIERTAPGPLHTDGECHEAAALVEIAVVPASLRIVVPRRYRPDRPARGDMGPP